MSNLLQKFEESQVKRQIPAIRPGSTVRVHQKIKEGNKERVQIFEGVVLSRHGGKGINSNITVRKIASGVGVERIFPLHLPSITKIEVVKEAKVRRAKLFYLRKLTGKATKLRDKKLSEAEIKLLTIEDAPEAKEEEILKAPEKKVELRQKETTDSPKDGAERNPAPSSSSEIGARGAA
ncbi:MAG: 50S ribosomal protein L19, partial [uncultured bacterium]